MTRLPDLRIKANCTSCGLDRRPARVITMPGTDTLDGVLCWSCDTPDREAAIRDGSLSVHRFDIARSVVRAFKALRTRGTHRIHIVLDIEAKWEKWKGFLLHDNGVPLTAYELEANRARFKELGYDAFPCCPSYDETGHCAGHPLDENGNVITEGEQRAE